MFLGFARLCLPPQIAHLATVQTPWGNFSRRLDARACQLHSPVDLPTVENEFSFLKPSFQTKRLQAHIW